MTKEDLNRRKSRAKLWKEFRSENLLTQTALAELLGISRRSVQYTERAEIAPHKETDRRFHALMLKYEAEKHPRRKRTKFREQQAEAING